MSEKSVEKTFILLHSVDGRRGGRGADAIRTQTGVVITNAMWYKWRETRVSLPSLISRRYSANRLAKRCPIWLMYREEHR